MPRRIHVDVETYSEIDLGARGAHVYAADPSTDVWCVSYSDDDGATVQTWTPGDPVPDWGDYILLAHNAAFERLILREILAPRYGFRAPRSYVCTMAAAAANGHPLSLAAAAKSLGLNVAKDDAGRRLMLKLCKPNRKGEKPEPTPDELEALISYCENDVIVECEIDKRVKLSEFEQQVYEVDQRINDRGVPLDLVTVRNIIRAIDLRTRELTDELQNATLTVDADGEISGDGLLDFWFVATPGQVVEIRDILAVKWGVVLPDLRAETVQTALGGELPDDARRVLEIRQFCALASTKKYAAMVASASEDGRARGLFAYCGAYQSGRWAGRRIQLQNLPHLDLDDDQVNAAVGAFNDSPATVRALLGEPMNVAKSLVRPMVKSETRLIVGDWAQIELRVAAWLSQQEPLLTELRGGVDVYRSMAGAIFGKPAEGVTYDERQLGKVTILGCQYGLGPKTFAMQLESRGIPSTLEFAEHAVRAFRERNDRIKSIWRSLADAALATYEDGVAYNVGPHLMIGKGPNGSIGMRLPSGRIIWYHNVMKTAGPYGPELTCSTVTGVTQSRKKLYGGLYFENACQGVARDLLAAALVRCDRGGLDVVGHVHDELLVEGDITPGVVQVAMEAAPEWADGLPIVAECFDCDATGGRYTK